MAAFKNPINWLIAALAAFVVCVAGFILFAQITGNIEASVRTRHFRIQKVLDNASIQEFTRIKPKDGFAMWTAYRWEAPAKPGSRSSDAFSVMFGQKQAIVFSGDASAAIEILKEAEQAHDTIQLDRFRYNPTNGTNSEGMEFRVFPQ